MDAATATADPYRPAIAARRQVELVGKFRVARRSDQRLAGRVGVSVSEFVSGGRAAIRSPSLQSPTLAAIR
jgi:hypothetical protein